MERNAKQKTNRPILKPSRSSHARMQFAGFGCGAPPPRRKNIPKAERSKVLHDAEQLVRVMANKEEGKDRALNKIVQEHSNTSDKYKFILEKPWRTGHAFHDEQDLSNSNVKGKIEEYKVKDPKSFATGTPLDRHTCSKDTQPTKVVRKASRDDEGIFDDIAASNNSLGFHDGIIDDSSALQQKDEDISKLKEAINKKESEHEEELKRVVAEQQKLVKSAQEALEQAHMSAEVKVCAIERKLADLTKQEMQRREAVDKWKSKSEMIENQLAQVELDRRMEVSSLKRKLASSEERILELNQRMVGMIKIEDMEEKIQSALEEFEEKQRLRELTMETDLSKLREEKDYFEQEICALREKNELLTNSENVYDQDVAVKISKLEEALEVAEARHSEALEKAIEEKDHFARQLGIFRHEQKQPDQAEEHTTSISGDQNTNVVDDEDQPIKIGELWERLGSAESKLHMECKRALHLEKENAALIEKLNAVTETEFASVEAKAICGLDEKVERLEKQLAAASDDLYQVKSENTELRVRNERMEDLLKESERLQKAENTKKEIMVADMESNIKVSEKLLKETEQQLMIEQEKSHQLKHVENQLESKEKDIHEVKKLHEQLERDFEKLSQQETMVKQEFSEASSRHRNEVNELEAEIKRSNDRIDELEREISTLIPVSQEVGRVKLSLHEKTEELRTSKSENERLHDHSLKLQSEVSTLNKTISELERKLDEANRRHEETASHLVNLETAQAKEQEILSEELREAENTIAGLMEEIHQMQDIANDLQITRAKLQNTLDEKSELECKIEELHRTKEREWGEMQAKLEDANQQVIDLREQLLPMTKELQQTKREMEELQHRMEDGDDGGEKEALRQLEEEIFSLRRELQVSSAALELSENQLASFRQDKENEFRDINEQIDRSRETIVQLQSELNVLRPKKLLLDHKEQECVSLRADLSAKEKQIDMCRLQLQDIEQDRNYSRARVAELDNLLHKSGNSHSLLEEKVNEVAQLKAERESLKQKLGVVEAFAAALEADNNQKKELVHEMLSKSGDSEGLAATTMIERLQKDLERTLKRCADLSLQLADSQFHIDQLTEEVRQSRIGTDTSVHRKFKRSGSYDSPNRTVSRKSISSMFANSISAMDESLRGVAGMRSENSMHGKKSLP